MKRWTLELVEVLILEHEAIGTTWKQIAIDQNCTYGQIKSSQRNRGLNPKDIKMAREFGHLDQLFTKECLDFVNRYPVKATLNDYCSHPAYNLVAGPPSAVVTGGWDEN